MEALMQEGQEPSLYPAWKQVAKDYGAMQLQPGAVLTIAELSEKFGLKEPVTAADQKRWAVEWIEAFTPFREALLTQHCVCLKSGYDGSYIVVPPGEQVAHAEKFHMKRVHKELRQAAQKMRHVDPAMLSDEENKQRIDAMARMGSIKSTVTNRRHIPAMPAPVQQKRLKLA